MHTHCQAENKWINSMPAKQQSSNKMVWRVTINSTNLKCMKHNSFLCSQYNNIKHLTDSTSCSIPHYAVTELPEDTVTTEWPAALLHKFQVVFAAVVHSTAALQRMHTLCTRHITAFSIVQLLLIPPSHCKYIQAVHNRCIKQSSIMLHL